MLINVEQLFPPLERPQNIAVTTMSLDRMTYCSLDSNTFNAKMKPYHHTPLSKKYTAVVLHKPPHSSFFYVILKFFKLLLRVMAMFAKISLFF